MKEGLVDNFDSGFTQQLILQPGQTPNVEISVGGVALQPDGDVFTEPKPEKSRWFKRWLEHFKGCFFPW